MRLTVSRARQLDFPAEPARTCASVFWKQRGPQGRSLSSPMPNQRSPSQTCRISCSFDPADVIVGDHVQSDLLNSVMGTAKSRSRYHSTFLSPQRFEALYEQLARAVIRGVTVDWRLWGAAEPGDSHTRNLANASEIARSIEADTTLRGRVRMRIGPPVHMPKSCWRTRRMARGCPSWVLAIG